MTDPSHAMPGPVPETARAVPETAVRHAGEGVGTPPETGGPTGPEPTRYGDWERKGRCIDF